MSVLAVIWSDPDVADILFLAAAIVAFADWLIAVTGRSELNKALLTVAIVLLALGLLAE